jgi:hypothetical protein
MGVHSLVARQYTIGPVIPSVAVPGEPDRPPDLRVEERFRLGVKYHQALSPTDADRDSQGETR